MVAAFDAGTESNWRRGPDNSFTIRTEQFSITVTGFEVPPPVRITYTAPAPTPPAFEIERFKTTELFENRLREKMAAWVQAAAIERGEMGYAPVVRKLPVRHRPEFHARSHPSCERRKHC